MMLTLFEAAFPVALFFPLQPMSAIDARTNTVVIDKSFFIVTSRSSFLQFNHCCVLITDLLPEADFFSSTTNYNSRSQNNILYLCRFACITVNHSILKQLKTGACNFFNRLIDRRQLYLLRRDHKVSIYLLS